MAIHRDASALSGTLGELMDRLCAPDLHLGEARDLRSRLATQMTRINEEVGTATVGERATDGTPG